MIEGRLMAVLATLLTRRTVCQIVGREKGGWDHGQRASWSEWEDFESRAPMCFRLSGLRRETGNDYCASPLGGALARA
jgi:hypothetical protein